MNKEIWMKPKISSNIGGEALIEGVMMRGNDRMAMSVRKGSGEIHTEIKTYVAITKRNKLLGLPFIRGAVSMLESMFVGIRVLLDSAELVDFAEDEKESKFDLWMQKKLGANYMTYLLYSSVVIALAFGIGLFMLLPNLIADFFTGFLSFDKSTGGGAVIANIIEGLIRIGLFILYVFLVSKNNEIKRVFQYHGAEHKTLFTLENDEELTVENVKKHTTLHPRCGTTFMFIVMLISIVVFTFAGWHSPIVNMLFRLALLPVIAGISYEVFKLAAKSNNKLVRAISLPGLMLQKITTQEPDDAMIEVAIASLKAVLVKETDVAAEVASAEAVATTEEAASNV